MAHQPTVPRRRGVIRRASVLIAAGLFGAGCSQSSNLSSAPSSTRPPAPVAPTTPPLVPAPPLTPSTIPAPAPPKDSKTSTKNTTKANSPAKTAQAPAPTQPPVVTQPGSADNSASNSQDIGSGACGLTAAPAAGSSTVTFVKDGRLFEVTTDGLTVCLKQLDAGEDGIPLWGPGGDKVLLNPSVLFDAKGARPTGFVAGNSGVRWSMATGKSLIAPAVKDGKLLKRLAGKADSRQDISFLTAHDATAYHPGGMHIFASGPGPEGNGLYIASNLGKDPRMIAQILEPTTKIIEIAAANDGKGVVFVHDHGSFRHVHRLQLPDLELTDLIETPAVISGLALSPGGRVAYTAGECGNSTAQLVTDPGSTVDLNQGPLAGKPTFVVGWIDDAHLLVGSGSKCSGPVDGFVVAADQPAFVEPVALGVDHLAVRTAVGQVGQLPGEIVAQAPG